MAPFRAGHDELEHDLPWRLMQNSPVTLYRRREYFDQDISELLSRGWRVPHFDCASWRSDPEMHEELRVVLELPDYTGQNFDALADSLEEMAVAEERGVMIALDNLTDCAQTQTLLDVLAGASRRWLLFGRIFGALVRTDDPSYRGPAIGAMRPEWNDREQLLRSRGER